LGSDLGSSTTSLTSLSKITISDNVTFDGQGYKIYININSFSGTFTLSGGTIQNIGVINGGTTTLANDCGYIVGSTVHNGYVYDCYSDGDITGNGSGGIVGATLTSSTLTIDRCTSSGPVTGARAGGIKGRLYDDGSIINISNCYTKGDISTNDSWGTSAGICGRAWLFAEFNITNCYHACDITNPTTESYAIVATSSGLSTLISVTNCYAIGTNAVLVGTDSRGTSKTQYIKLTNCIAQNLSPVGTTLHADSTNNSVDQTTIQGSLTGPAASWDTNYWTAGSGSNYPTLNQFQSGLWGGYTSHTDSATLSPGEGGGGGDPHMNPLIGKPYTLPKTEDTFLLIDNKVDHDRLVIKAKCWYLPKEQYQDPLVRAFDRNASKHNKLKDLFENGTFFKYIKIEYKGKEVIIDMDDLSLKNYDGKANLYSGSLPPSDKQGFKYGDMLTVGKIIGSKKGLYTATSTKTTHDTAYRTIMRTVEINTLDNNLTIELARDRKNIARRNSIKLSVNGNIGKFGGALIRKDVQIIDF